MRAVTLSITIGTGSAEQATIALRGELDQSTAAQLREAVATALDAGAADIRVDLGEVTFVGSSGLGALVRAHQAAQGRGRRLALDGVSDILFERLHLAGLVDLLGVRRPAA